MPTDAPDPAIGQASGIARAEAGFGAHARTVMGLTMGSRVSGLVREAVCSRMFGTAAPWSAWLTAFIIPNLFRRLFGEGAISAAFIPEYARLVREDPGRASRLASLTVAGVTATVGALVVVAEIVLMWLLANGGLSENARHVVLYTAIMLPYAPLICGTAILFGMLQSHGSFVESAAGPIILNVFISVAAWVAVSGFGMSVETAATLLAVTVLGAGCAQLAWSLWSLRAHVHWTRDVADVRPVVMRMLGRMVPVVLGMAALQINSVFDQLLAGLSLLTGPNPSWLGGATYPLDAGTPAVLFYAQRLYQFPLGVFGIAIATVAFPAMSRQIREPEAFMGTLRHGIRVGAFIAMPAAIGLMMVARPLVDVVYSGGEFEAEDAARVTGVLRAYAPAIVAYSMIHVLTRAYYAHGLTWAPMAAGVTTVGLNIVGSVALMWPLAERGLAVATSVSSFVQLGMLVAMAPRRVPACEGRPVLDAETWRSMLHSFLLSGAMVGAIIGASLIPLGVGDGWWASAVILARDVAVGGAVYLGGSVLMHRPELRSLVERRKRA